MSSKNGQNWPPFISQQALGGTKLSESSSFGLESRQIPHFEAPTREFRVPSPTDTSSDDEGVEPKEGFEKLRGSKYASQKTALDIRSLPGVLISGNESDHISRLGDSTSLFSASSTLEESPLPSQKPKKASLSENRLEIPRQGEETGTHTQNRFGTMVVEREPPKPAASSPQKLIPPTYQKTQQPEFGKPSPLRNQLQSSVFNIPKPYQPRAEHHRTAPSAVSHLQQSRNFGNEFINPFQPRKTTQSVPKEDVVEIPRPANHATWTTHRSAQSLFSSFPSSTTGFPPVEGNKNVQNFIDLSSALGIYHPDRAIFDDGFGAADPETYLDAGQATENIKALLEGVFEDDDDKSRTRNRNKINSAVSGLSDKLRGLDVKIEQKSGEQVEDEEEIDDGTVEGLKVKLLPHQVDGVEWMKGKEIGIKKKNGILPKGGILADDVRPLTSL